MRCLSKERCGRPGAYSRASQKRDESGVSTSSPRTIDPPLFTPSTKESVGHDVTIDFDTTASIVGADAAARLRHLTLAVYRRACEVAEARGVLIADTKLEFGLAGRRGDTSTGSADEVVLIDEVLTPDSSRFWPRASYHPGHGVPSFDKQFVRDYLEDIEWNKQPPVPVLPENVVNRTREKYVEAFRLLSGRELQ